MTHRAGEQQGGGAEGARKAKKKPSGRGGMARNTMGHGHGSKNMGSSGAMGKHQSTGDGGSSDFSTGPHSPPG